MGLLFTLLLVTPMLVLGWVWVQNLRMVVKGELPDAQLAEAVARAFEGTAEGDTAHLEVEGFAVDLTLQRMADGFVGVRPVVRVKGAHPGPPGTSLRVRSSMSPAAGRPRDAWRVSSTSAELTGKVLDDERALQLLAPLLPDASDAEVELDEHGDLVARLQPIPAHGQVAVDRMVHVVRLARQLVGSPASRQLETPGEAPVETKAADERTAEPVER